ncbi:hypothetical protein VTI74DRAFT_5984 [Chaetomium olivicolor]
MPDVSCQLCCKIGLQCPFVFPNSDYLEVKQVQPSRSLLSEKPALHFGLVVCSQVPRVDTCPPHLLPALALIGAAPQSGLDLGPFRRWLILDIHPPNLAPAKGARQRPKEQIDIEEQPHSEGSSSARLPRSSSEPRPNHQRHFSSALNQRHYLLLLTSPMR